MALFLVTPLASNHGQISQEIADAVLDSLPLQSDAGFLVSFSGTTEELCKVIGVTTDDPQTPTRTGPALVTTVMTYYGRGNTSMWEWMKSRLERNS